MALGASQNGCTWIAARARKPNAPSDRDLAEIEGWKGATFTMKGARRVQKGATFTIAPLSSSRDR